MRIHMPRRLKVHRRESRRAQAESGDNEAPATPTPGQPAMHGSDPWHTTKHTYEHEHLGGRRDMHARQVGDVRVSIGIHHNIVLD